nr:PE-PGRS family protein PE_PGRS5-like [Aegilops tauschii subsp. strangulata]
MAGGWLETVGRTRRSTSGVGAASTGRLQAGGRRGEVRRWRAGGAEHGGGGGRPVRGRRSPANVVGAEAEDGAGQAGGDGVEAEDGAAWFQAREVAKVAGEALAGGTAAAHGGRTAGGRRADDAGSGRSRAEGRRRGIGPRVPAAGRAVMRDDAGAKLEGLQSNIIGSIAVISEYLS